MILKKIKLIFWKIFTINSKNLRENYLGTFKIWRLIILNIIRPGRLINRLKYSQVFKNKNKRLNYFKNLLSNKSKNILTESKKDKLIKGLDDLFIYGGCVIPEYFSEEEIEQFKNYNKNIINILTKPQTGNINKSDILTISSDLIKIWLDEGLLSLMKVFFGTKVYTRNYPFIYYTKIDPHYKEISLADAKKLRLANMWHVDHSVLFNVHVILKDIEQESSRMQILKTSDKFHHYSSNFSDETVSESGFEKIECIGKKGTVYLHTGNVVHRFKPVPGTDRLVTHFEFSPGSNILLNTKGIVKSLKDGFNLDSLEQEKMEIIYPLFPRNLFKGYDVKNNKFKPTSFKGI